MRAPELIAWTVVLASAAAIGCDGPGVGAQANADGAGPPPAVEAVQARSGTLPLVERLSGMARAADQVEVRPEIAGVVAEVLLRSGDAVRTGQPLVRLRDEVQREQLVQATAAVRLAEASSQEAEARRGDLQARVARARRLADERLISAMELETLEAQLAAAEAAVAQERARVEQGRATVAERRAAVERTVVRAPVDGRVGRRNIEVGARVDPDTLLFVVGGLDRLIVEVPLTEMMLGYLEPGQPVRLGSPVLGEAVLEAELARISPFLAAGSLSTVGEVDVDNRDGPLRPGMFVTVDVHYGESRRATLVPTSALWEDPRTGLQFVFVPAPEEGADPERAPAGELSERAVAFEQRQVDVVAEGRGSIGVGGVDPGEWVVTVGQHLLAEEQVRTCRVRRVSWERVIGLQGLQREDLLQGFLDKQRRVARERGAVPPSNEEYVGAAATP